MFKNNGFTRSVPAVLLAAGFLVVSGCGEKQSAVFDGQKAFAETDALVKIGLRDAGSGGARRAADHLESRLTALGFKTTVDTFREETPNGPMFFNNVLGRLPGKNAERLIIIGSHFDTKRGVSSDFQGANDSGSGTGVLLELARVLAERASFDTDILVAFFDGEKCRGEYGPTDGLHGSRHLAQQMYDAGGVAHVEAVVILNMVGDQNLNITIPRNSSRSLVKNLFDAADELGFRPSFGLAQKSIVDDHIPFFLAGMPVINVIDFEYGSRPGLNDYWQTRDDTMDKLSAKSMEQIGQTVVRMIENFQ